MGTSSCYGTPTKGNWSSAKRALSAFGRGGRSSQSSVTSILANTARALSGGGGGRGGTGGGGLITHSARTAIAGGIGFLTTAANTGIRTALERIGITDGHDLDGTELVDRISEALVAGRFSLDQEIAVTALRETLLSILGPDADSFEECIERFMNDKGIEGFVTSFLSHYVLERVWQHIADAARERINTEAEISALYDGLEMLCRVEIEKAVNELCSYTNFGKVDWFGPQGRQVADQLVGSITTNIEGLI